MGREKRGNEKRENWKREDRKIEEYHKNHLTNRCLRHSKAPLKRRERGNR
jgi:hypothetical protein